MCGGECHDGVIACPTCAKKVFLHFGSSSNQRVKDYINLMNPVRYNKCRVCAAEITGTLTVCALCEAKVLLFAGGTEDRHVRAYITHLGRLRAKGLQEEELPRDMLPPRGPYVPKKKVKVKSLNHKCVCGQFYEWEISVMACEARDHRPLNR